VQLQLKVELLIEGAEYTRCEVELAARREMVVRQLEDFMRRRCEDRTGTGCGRQAQA
jgi:hypothetical protein